MKNKKTIVIAHRGASALVGLDNTIESFEKAIEIGADAIEFDVRRTMDGKLITFHDEGIDGIPIANLTYQALLDKTQSKGYKVPTVEDVLKLSVGKIKLDIELKESGYEAEVVKLVKKYLTYDTYYMKSFLDDTVAAISKLDPNIHTGLLLGVGNPKYGILTRIAELFPGYRLRKAKANFVAPHYRLLKLNFLKRMKNYPVYVWTVNNESIMKKLIKHRVEGIITDRPDKAIKLL